MTTKKLLIPLAIMLISPFAANAREYNRDFEIVQVPKNLNQEDTVIVSYSDGPYAIADINSSDETHIATTAYVKGAYNDTIAALNTMNINKQMQLVVEAPDDDYYIGELVRYSLDQVSSQGDLVNGMAVKNAIDDVNDTIASKRVTIYTTWDDDSANATTQVALSTAQ